MTTCRGSRGGTASIRPRTQAAALRSCICTNVQQSPARVTPAALAAACGRACPRPRRHRPTACGGLRQPVQLGAQLSGGEQWKLSIGRALMTHPALIILDEATEGLAPQVVAEIWRVIDQIRADGIATLIVDRDYHKVLAHSDYALVLQKGEAVMNGPAAELAGSAELAGYLGLRGSDTFADLKIEQRSAWRRSARHGCLG